MAANKDFRILVWIQISKNNEKRDSKQNIHLIESFQTEQKNHMFSNKRYSISERSQLTSLRTCV